MTANQHAGYYPIDVVDAESGEVLTSVGVTQRLVESPKVDSRVAQRRAAKAGLEHARGGVLLEQGDTLTVGGNHDVANSPSWLFWSGDDGRVVLIDAHHADTPVSELGSGELDIHLLEWSAPMPLS